MNHTIQTLALKDFARIFGDSAANIPQECRQLIDNVDFRHKVLRGPERKTAIAQAIEILERDLPYAGNDQKSPWEQVWHSNLNDFVSSSYNTDSLVPSFSKDARTLRLEGEYIQPEQPDFEINFVRVLRHWLFEKWFEPVDHVYEFGCGTGHNLVDLASHFPDKSLHGFDWTSSSQKIVSLLAEHRGLNISGGFFDMLSPDENTKLVPSSGILTIGAMEQLGEDHGPFLEFLINNSPAICVHVETLFENYDRSSEFDDLAARYLVKRGYLHGYLHAMEKLQLEGRVEILQLRRTLGSFLHDGYTCLVWRPTQLPAEV